ncbi:hypothetical protein GCM10010515_21420 [Streptomyces fructofermentans]|uniref:Uncharacterized protein n=1 Tax=Streptomyces fructofermentans TaxID=152141 RepID=A0A918NAL6_9ACTN|nr:hypothetical protein GCM10010515_21420 [Streptomyces fructofermentans]
MRAARGVFGTTRPTRTDFRESAENGEPVRATARPIRMLPDESPQSGVGLAAGCDR